MLTREQAVEVAIPEDFRDRYLIRCVDQKFGPSSKGNPMITLNWEVAGYQAADGSITTQIKRGDKTYEVGGANVTQYITLTAGPALARYFQLRESLALGQTDNVDENNPPLDYIGVVAHAILSAEVTEQRKAPTPEQRAAGQPGDPILDPATNQPVKRIRPRLESVLGKADVPNLPY